MTEKEWNILNQPFEYKITEDLHLLLFPNTHPGNLEIAALQKGIVIQYHGKEVVEEGIGFGVPVVKYTDEVYFSTSAESFVFDTTENVIWMKSYILDAVSRKRIGDGPLINEGLYSLLHKGFEKLYLNYSGGRSLFDAIMKLRRSLKINTYFVKVEPKGKINITYTLESGTLKIKMGVQNLKRSGCEEILVLNEQGANFFRKYMDTSNLELFDRGIGAWDMVEAKEASLCNLEETFGFSLEKKEGVKLYRGWESVDNGISWTGFCYSLPPKTSNFDYTIRLMR